MGKLALVLVSLAALAAAIAACGEEEETTPGASNTPAASQTPPLSATPGESATAVSTYGTLPVCPTQDARTYRYEPITGSDTKQHTDEAADYTVTYPAEWLICQVAQDPQIPDLVSTTQLYDSGGLLRASVTIRGNPMALTLEEWIRAYNPFFYEKPTEERLVSGQRMLVALTCSPETVQL